MRALTIKAEITVNLGNYENFKIGGEWELAPGEEETAAIHSALRLLYQAGKIYQQLGPQESVPTCTSPTGRRREVLTEGHPRYLKVVEALKTGRATVKTVEDVFELTDVMKKYFSDIAVKKVSEEDR